MVALPKLPIRRNKQGQWWVTECPDPTCPGMGPYNTRAEAEVDRRGVLRHYAAAAAYGAQNRAHWSVPSEFDHNKDWDEESSVFNLICRKAGIG